MEWNNTFSTMKGIGAKSMPDMVPVPNAEVFDVGLSSSEKGSLRPQMKPRKKTMTSLYLKFFETAPDGKSRRCKFCKQNYSIATATGNLGRHLNHHHPGYEQQVDNEEHPPQSVIRAKKPQAQAKPVTMDFDNLNWLLLKWLMGASLPSFTFEDEALQNSLKYLNPSVKLWPNERVQAVTLEIFRSMREDIKASLALVNSKVSITLDSWTSYEQLSYMAVRCHWIDENWSMHKVLLDVSPIPYPCTGSEIFYSLIKVLQMFDIENRILSCTDGSHHSCHALKEELDAQKVPFCYIPCAARNLNLIIEEGLRTPKPILSKIREFALEVNLTSEIAQDFQQLTAMYQEGTWTYPLDTSASWNGDYTMLNIAREAANSMDSVIKKHEETFGMRNLLLSTTEKSVINVLHAYLEPFYKTTTNLCTCKVHTIGLVLFFMDHIFEMITSCRDSCRHEWLKNVADMMSQRATSFSVQAYNLFTFTAAILDPRIKMELIPDNLNSAKYLEEARSHFTRDYATNQFSAMANGYGSKIVEEINVVSFAEEIARKRRRGSVSTISDEMSQYLSEPPAPITTDVLYWWKSNSTRYPRLSIMARDYLAVQGTSVEPDELFSSKGDEAHKQQFGLPCGSMQSVMCINSWVKSGFKLKFGSSIVDYEKLMESGVASFANARP